MTWTPQAEERVAAAVREAARPRAAADDVQQRVDAVLAGHRRRRRVTGAGVLAAVVLAGGLVGHAVYESAEREAGGSAVASLSAQASRSARAERRASAEAQASEAAAQQDPDLAFRTIAQRLPRGTDLALLPRLERRGSGSWRLVLGRATVDVPGRPPVPFGAPGSNAVLRAGAGDLVVPYEGRDGRVAVLTVHPDGRRSTTTLPVDVHGNVVVSPDGRRGLVARGELDGGQWSVAVVGLDGTQARIERTVPVRARAGWTTTGVEPVALVGERAVVRVDEQRAEPAAPVPARGGLTATPLPPTGDSSPETRTLVLEGGRMRPHPDVWAIGAGRYVVTAGGCQREVPATEVLDDAAARRRPCLDLSGPAQSSPDGALTSRFEMAGEVAVGTDGRMATTTITPPAPPPGEDAVDLGGGQGDGPVLAVREARSGRVVAVVRLSGAMFSVSWTWEDAGHLIFAPVSGDSVVRVDVRAGTAERVPLPDGVDGIAW